MERQRNIFQKKEQNKAPEKELNKMETSNLPDGELKILIIRMHNELKGRGNELSENFNKEIKNIKVDIEIIKEKQSEVKNTIAEMKYTLEEINNTLDMKQRIEPVIWMIR